MEVQDGFIVHIYDYCDRWCEACAFTSRCQAFSAAVETERTPTPRWLQECVAEMNAVLREPTTERRFDRLLRCVAPEHHVIEQRARAYSLAAAGCLQTMEIASDRDHGDPRTIAWRYCVLIPTKVYRALAALANEDIYAEHWPLDHDGSAKVALMAVDRSRAAWIAMAERGLAPVVDVERFVSDLSRLADDLDRVFPNARAFVRPGLDEPEEVAKLS
jgi:hypothetical protein